MLRLSIFVSSIVLIACGTGDGEPRVDPDASLRCDEFTPCEDPARSYCDIEGTTPESGGVPNTCIPEPEQTECSDTRRCTDESKPACTSNGQCVECVNFATCDTENPVCKLSTHTCGPCRVGEGDAVCAAIDPLQPLCSELGSCSECLDNTHCSIVSKPICDQTSFSCRGCALSEECASGNCDLDNGVCEPG